MKNWTWILLGCVLAAGASVLTSALVAPSRERAGASEAERLASLERTVGELAELARGLEERERELRSTLDALAVQPAASARSELGGVDAAVARWMTSNAIEIPALATPRGGAARPEEASSDLGDTQSIVERILGGGFDDEEAQALWDRLRKEGRIDEVVAAIEELAAERPNDPELAVDLGNAYIQKIFDVGMGPMAGTFAQKADEAFDRALELDPEHWEARFTKAVSLSNWPAFLGMAGEAISQFETLATQQEHRPAEPHYAQTYYFLGNMYLQTGETAKAVEAWQRGLALFPGDETLAGQIATYSTQGGGR
jgi:tetratricopeptide (TPR) repeat protein